MVRILCLLLGLVPHRIAVLRYSALLTRMTRRLVHAPDLVYILDPDMEYYDPAFKISQLSRSLAFHIGSWSSGPAMIQFP